MQVRLPGFLHQRRGLLIVCATFTKRQQGTGVEPVRAGFIRVSGEQFLQGGLIVPPQEASCEGVTDTLILAGFSLSISRKWPIAASSSPSIRSVFASPALARMYGWVSRNPQKCTAYPWKASGARGRALPPRGLWRTDLTPRWPGALHRANGGAILIDARALLAESFSWPALKRALLRGQIVIEDIASFLGLTATVSLEPGPIPLDIKVVLFGDRVLYYLMSALDPEFAQHFKVLADFDDGLKRTPENEAAMARLIAAMITQGKFNPFDRAAVAVSSNMPCGWRKMPRNSRFWSSACRISSPRRATGRQGQVPGSSRKPTWKQPSPERFVASRGCNVG
jgi:hypothetical protein